MAKKRKSGGRGVMLLGLLAGAVVGAAVALVYSPGTGEQNREQLVEYVSDKVSA